MAICIQDPNDPESTYLLEALLEACEGAVQGGGTFAFASTEGVRLFLGDEVFREFAESGEFNLLVGMDAITNTSALTAIKTIKDSSPNLEAQAYLSDKARSLFHPKFCWFRKKKGGVLVTGSGNLTGGGLRWNVEAFNVLSLSKSEIDAVESRWDGFLNVNSSRIFSLGDERIQQQAIKNATKMARAVSAIKSEGQLAGAVEPLVESQAEVQAQAEVDLELQGDITRPDESDAVLLAEIPQSGKRWKQANFSQAVFTGFFGAALNTQRRIYLYNVNANGTLRGAEIRPSVAVKSQNYRFELDAASGLEYPQGGRPIGVFVRVATRTFIYVLLMPNDVSYEAISKYLGKISTTPANQMRREVVTVADVRKVWVDSPLWKNIL